MDYQQYYNTEVFPLLPPEQIWHFTAQYPQVHFIGDTSLAALPIVMLVALTGTGKSTTIQHLQQHSTLHDIQFNTIPTRRDLANMVTIPLAQMLLNEKISPISNRIERFQYTNTFAEHVIGGFAAAFTWLYWHGDVPPVIVSEGVRGHTEIAYALHNTRWHIVELTATPLTRLRRLSSRDEAFDKAHGTDDLSFLPENQRDSIRAEIDAGNISPKAISIMAAEANNYGLDPYPLTHERYTQIATDTTAPEAVAGQVTAIIQQMR